MHELLTKAEDFEFDTQRFNIDTRFLEYEFSRSLKNYNNITKRLKTLNLPNPNTFKYSKLSLPELKELISTILNKVFSSSYDQEIEQYHSILKLHNISNPFDAALETTYNGDIVSIHISRELSSIEVVATAHEYIHALLAKHSTYRYNDVLTNIHYKELLSLLIEYISVYELSQLLKNEQLPEKHNIIRLHTDKEHAITNEENKKLLYSLRKPKEPISKSLQSCLDYIDHTDFGYIVSDIYATRLFEIYQDDPKTLLSIYKSILDGEKSINDLLKYYGISLRDNNTTQSFYKRLDNIPKL